jgi:hypothetical protein
MLQPIQERWVLYLMIEQCSKICAMRYKTHLSCMGCNIACPIIFYYSRARASLLGEKILSQIIITTSQLQNVVPNRLQLLPY